MNGEKYLTNSNVNGNGGTPTFKEIAEPSVAQEWKFTIDSNGEDCYKITSNADGRYMNEYGVFGTNAYYSDWNTYLLTVMGKNYSLQWTQSAVKDGKETFIVVSGERLEAKEVSRSESYTITIISKDENMSVEDIRVHTLKQHGSNIVADTSVESISVYSADGRLIKEEKSNCISTSSLAKGIYIAIARYDNSTEALRFIVE
jgi:hypothetical protein